MMPYAYAGLWAAAHSRREALLDFITRSGGLATLMDYRRIHDYDSDKLTDQYLDQADVKVRPWCASSGSCVGQAIILVDISLLMTRCYGGTCMHKLSKSCSLFSSLQT